MSLLEFNDQYKVNFEEIDNQHKMIFGMINSLHDAMKQGKAKDIMAELIKNLADYAVYHFQAEERYMKEYSYPLYMFHQKEHQSFVKKVKDFQQKHERQSHFLLDMFATFQKDFPSS